MSGQKIIDGLRDALRFAQCDHDWVRVELRPDGRERVRCTICGMSQTNVPVSKAEAR